MSWEERRFWMEVFKMNLDLWRNPTVAALSADEALEEFRKRFPPSGSETVRPNSEALEEHPKKPNER